MEPVPEAEYGARVVPKPRAAKVLAVEDDELVRFVIERVVRKMAIDVRGAGSGPDGLKMLDDEDFGLLVCDLQLPGIGVSGLSLCRAACERGVPVLAISGFLRDTDRAALDDLGASYLAKPFTASELRKAIEAAVDRQ